MYICKLYINLILNPNFYPFFVDKETKAQRSCLQRAYIDIGLCVPALTGLWLKQGHNSPFIPKLLWHNLRTFPRFLSANTTGTVSKHYTCVSEQELRFSHFSLWVPQSFCCLSTNGPCEGHCSASLCCPPGTTAQSPALDLERNPAVPSLGSPLRNPGKLVVH